LNEAAVVLVRSIIGFFTLLIFARLLGKQQISQLTFFEYVLGITIGSIAASLSVDLTSRAWPHWVGLFTWTAIVFTLQWISVRSPCAAKYLVGEPTIIIMNGQIMENNMRKIRYTTSDLLEQLRDKGVFDLNQVAYAVLETDGQLSVLLKPEFQPVTPQDLNITPQNVGPGVELVSNGIVIEENLKKINQDRLWLESQLKEHGIENFSEVFLATYIPETGEFYIDKYNERDSV